MGASEPVAETRADRPYWNGTDGRDLVARMLEHHGVAALAYRHGEVVWANRVALDLVDPVERPIDDEGLLALLDRGFRPPVGVSTLAPGEERVVEVELASSRAWLRLSAIAFGGVDEAGEVVMVTFRAPLERSVDPSQVARLEAMLDSTNEIITVIDREGRIRFSNAAGGRITGISGAEANGTDLFDLVHPEDADVVAEAFARGVLAGEPIDTVAVRIRMADGEWRNTEARLSGVVEVDGVEGHVITISDVTDRVQRDQERFAHHRRLESIVENIDDVIVILGSDLSVQWTSPGIERLIDAPAYTNVGENAFNDMHPDDVGNVIAALQAAMATPDGRSRAMMRLHHERHGWRWIDSMVVNRLDDPAVGGLVCTLRVVDDQEGAASPQRQRDLEVASLREADRLKDRFLATVSHELRTPLASVRGFSALLEGQWPEMDDDTRNHLVGRISANARSMETLIEQLLDYSRLQAGAVDISVAEVAVGPAVSDVVESLSHHLENHVVTVDAGAEVVLADRDAFGHVMRNLLTNAARYSSPGTGIEVTAQADGHEVHIRVTDHGIGIAPEDHARIFQSFFQSAPGLTHRRGTGIGLNIARRYAQLQSGHLTLKSEPGRGSTFTFTLPSATRSDASRA